MKEMSRVTNLLDVDDAVAGENGEVHRALKKNPCAALHVCAFTDSSLTTHQQPTSSFLF